MATLRTPRYLAPWQVLASLALAGALLLPAARLQAQAAEPMARPRPDVIKRKDVRLFADSPAWSLARAVQFQQGWLIRLLLLARPAGSRYQEPVYGQTLLYYAVFTHRYLAVRALLKGGADPNAAFENRQGKTPLVEAARNYDTSKYVRLLLAHGADPNLATRPPGPPGLTTPLIEAAWSRLETVQVLLAQGATLNYITPTGFHSALKAALVAQKIDIARYLLLEQHAAFRQPMGQTIDGDTFYIADLLKELPYELDSPKHRTKMELVRYLEARGVDYRGAPVPKRYYRMYPKEFIQAY
ncbi:ankyrin repeat domain-containing protein [Hymenobacter sp. BT683]|uniref:Ankyrin repeat domain-containing protein n=1 Tax=Hymenobacter jeongseonensis TaxID=2791027 RepID=A0ABS0IEP6_9BACT|nr:ankyrin repeat domain-containing protein [Hymenobacter jeongseonensis]MBF9236539.1 ankyrin repeat domain-containing protein [Hymenobacter jeongseonensis]